MDAAVAALVTWDPDTEPEPPGWFRNPDSGRRREGGDPEKETVWW